MGVTEAKWKIEVIKGRRGPGVFRETPKRMAAKRSLAPKDRRMRLAMRREGGVTQNLQRTMILTRASAIVGEGEEERWGMKGPR